MKKKILLITNTASFFYTHRLNLYRSLNQKYDVDLIFGKNGHPKMEAIALLNLNNENIKYKIFDFESSNINIFREIKSLAIFYKYISKTKPDYLHCVSIKPIFLLGIISIFFRKIKIILAFSGLGYLFSETNSFRSRFLRVIFKLILKIIFIKKNKKIIVQNNNDYFYFKNKFKIDSKDIKIIRGSGVDTSYYKPNYKIKKEKIILFPSRLLKDKGFNELISASKKLKIKFPEWKIYLVGASDYNNPNSISINTIKQIVKNDNIIWYDYTDKIIDYYLISSIVCLPSYREGLSKSLLEAASTGCPIVTSNAPGCIDSIINGKTGLLAEVKNVKSLIIQLESLMNNKKLRQEFSLNARKYIIENFDQKIILKQFDELYEKF